MIGGYVDNVPEPICKKRKIIVMYIPYYSKQTCLSDPIASCCFKNLTSALTSYLKLHVTHRETQKPTQQNNYFVAYKRIFDAIPQNI